MTEANNNLPEIRLTEQDKVSFSHKCPYQDCGVVGYLSTNLLKGDSKTHTCAGCSQPYVVRRAFSLAEKLELPEAPVALKSLILVRGTCPHNDCNKGFLLQYEPWQTFPDVVTCKHCQKKFVCQPDGSA